MLRLQRLAGNAAVSAAIAGRAPVVQRQAVAGDAEFKAAVDRGDFPAAIGYLSGLDPAAVKDRVDRLAIDRCLGMLPVVPPDQHKVRAPLLDRAYLDARSQGAWDKAATYLSGFNSDDIVHRLADPAMGAKNLKLLAKGARNGLGAGAEYLLSRIRDALKAQPGELFGKVGFSITPTHGSSGGGCNASAPWECKAVITFDPDPDVAESDEIAFVQTIRIVDSADERKGKVTDSEDDRKGIDKRLNDKQQAVDRERLNKSGWYGYYNDGRHPMVTPGRSPGPPPGQARMEDTPGQTTRKAGTTWGFETSIIAKTGKDTNLVYSVVLWGFSVDSDLHLTVRDHTIQDQPTGGFGSAVAAWNRQATGPERNRSDPGQEPLPNFR